MKYEWYFSDNIKGIVNSYSAAVEELNKHLDFDITNFSEYKTQYVMCNEMPCGLGCETAYFYPGTMPDEEIRQDNGTHTPRIRGVCEKHYDYLK